MAKDDFIGIRVSKGFKKFLLGEAKRKGMSLSEYIEFHTDDNFKLTKKHLESLLERAKEDLPDFWSEAEKYQIVKEFEKIIPMMATDFLNPIKRTLPSLLPAFMLLYIPLLVKNTIVHIDAINEEHKSQAIHNYLSAGKIIAENLNKLKIRDSEEQKVIISAMKDMMETFAFSFTSMAFEKDSFVKIKVELDKTEKTLLHDIEKVKR
jgi:hypothetical protein